MFEDLFSLAGKSALITGGGRGIGLETARLLGRAGATLALLDRDADALSAATESLRDEGIEALALVADLLDETASKAATERALAKFGGLDILVNNAALVLRTPALETDMTSWRRVMAVNLDAAFHISCQAAVAMRATGGGAIVNVSSIMGMSGGGLYPIASYHASKGGLINLTRGLAAEWAPFEIRVNAIAPTWIRTEFTAAILDQPEIAERLLSTMSIRRFAEPRDAAAAILYLVSPAARMVTGHVLAVDGGFLAR